MIDFELFMKIKNFHEQKGLKPGQIARELGLDPRTVQKWLQEKRFRPRKSAPQRESRLDPFKDSILRMLEAHPYTAAQVLRAESERMAMRVPIPSSKTMFTKSGHDDLRPFSNSPLRRASVPRLIGAPIAPSGWVRPIAGSASLSWCFATAA